MLNNFSLLYSLFVNTSKKVKIVLPRRETFFKICFWFLLTRSKTTDNFDLPNAPTRFTFLSE